MSKKQIPKKQEPARKPGDTDPQEKMQGPVSSFIQGIKKEAEENDKETKEDADKKKDQNT